MLFDDLPADAQAETGAAVAVFVGVFRCVKWLKNLAQLVGGNPNPRVSDANLRHACDLILADIDSQASASRHRLASVDDEIDQDLLDLSGDDGPVATSAVAAELGRKPASLSPARDGLIKKGLIYSAERGTIGFTVPHFGRYLRGATT